MSKFKTVLESFGGQTVTFGNLAIEIGFNFVVDITGDSSHAEKEFKIMIRLIVKPIETAVIQNSRTNVVFVVPIYCKP